MTRARATERVVEAGAQANDADAPAIRDSLLRRVIPSAMHMSMAPVLRDRIAQCRADD